jgi:2-aminoethylphosphonate-pyruvate transaminase
MTEPPSETPDKLLFTPGPLTTSRTVKQAMLHDAGSWHLEFNERVRWIRDQLLELAELSRADGWVSIPLQGSGTYGIESVFATCVPPGGKVCVLANGAYGERMALMLQRLKISHTVMRAPENELHDLTLLDRILSTDPTITHVAAVHCETTTGILNPVEEIGRIVKRHCCLFMVDAMSSFGAIPIDLESGGIDFLVSSPNKCLEGVPGFSFVITRRETLFANEGQARSLSLDLIDQLGGFEKNDQFRFTPPTHTLLAFEQALKELDWEGGVVARGARYWRNHAILLEGMKRLGFKPYLPSPIQSCIITAFHYPSDERFQFLEFYRRLSEKGFIIYPGKLTHANTFRIASIGHLFEPDLCALVKAVGEVMEELGVHLSTDTTNELRTV